MVIAGALVLSKEANMHEYVVVSETSLPCRCMPGLGVHEATLLGTTMYNVQRACSKEDPLRPFSRQQDIDPGYITHSTPLLTTMKKTTHLPTRRTKHQRKRVGKRPGEVERKMELHCRYHHEESSNTPPQPCPHNPPQRVQADDTQHPQYPPH